MMPTLTDLESMIAQLIFPRIGSNMTPIVTVEEDEPRVAELIQRAKIGGLCLFNGHWPTTAESLRRLQQLSEIPLLVAADIEQGVGQQIHGMTLFPHALVFDSLDADCDSYLPEFARTTAREALDTGIHIALGPVADVHSDPHNPIISTRAFSADPDKVASRVANYIQSAQAERLLCTAKHFPGHGNTREDSHDSTPIVLADRETLDARELRPFRAAIQSNVALMMTAHVAYATLDPSGQVATLSYPIVTQLLRNELGFRGAVISDSMLMAGARSAVDSEVELALAALAAGVDILIDIADPVATIRGIAAAVNDGRVPVARIQQACDRVLHLKKRQVLRQPGESLRGPIAQSQALADEIALTACRKFSSCPANPDPLARSSSVGVLYVTSMADNAYGARFIREDVLADCLRRAGYQVHSAVVSASSANPPIQSTAEQCDQLVIALLVKPAAWQRFGLLPQHVELVNGLLSTRQMQSLPTTLVSLGTPHVLDQFPHAERRLCAFSDVPASQRAVARLLMGTPS